MWNSGAMFLIALFVVLPILWLLFTNWQLALVALGIWLLIRVGSAVTGSGGHEVARELPPLGYMPRWTASRRLDAEREHARWQGWFDRAR